MPRDVQRIAFLSGVIALTAVAPVAGRVYPISSFPRLQGVIVRDVTEDAHGAVWLGTDGGLWRWSGTEFERIPSDLPEGTSVLDLVLLADDRFLLACTDGVRAIDPRTLKLDEGFRALPNRRVNKIVIGHDHTIWVGAEPGLFRFTPTPGGARTKIVRGTESLPVNALILDGPDGLLVGSDSGVWRILPNTEAAPVFGNALGKGRVIALARSRNGAIWIGQRRPGQLTRVSGEATRTFGLADGLTDPEINDIVQHPNGDIWVAAEHGVFRRVRDQFERMDRTTGLPNEDVHCLFVDSEEQLWIGAFGHGVFRLRSPHVVTYTYEDGLAHPVITSLRNGPDNTLIAGTFSGAARLNPEKSTVERIGPGDHIQSVFADATGDIWLARDFDAIRLSDPTPINVSYAVRIVQDGDSGLVFCSRPGPKRWVDGVLSDVDIPEATAPECKSLAAGPDRTLFVVTVANELVRVGDGGNQVLLRGEPLGAVVVDHAGRVLIGMRHGIFELVDGDVRPLNDRRGQSFSVRDFAVDGPDRVWGATDHGIARIDGGEIEWFDYEDGLPARDVRNVTVGADGYLYAGTTQGLARIDTDRLQPCMARPRLTIEEVLAGSQRARTGDPDLIANYPACHVSVTVRANGWRSCTRLTYRFKLVGRDDYWSPPTSSPLWQGTDLKPGAYTLLAKAVNQRGVESTVARASFTLMPPFWQGSAFQALFAGLIVVAVIVGVGAIRRRRALRRALRMTEQAKREFVTRMSHELRTPLTVLIASADLIARDQGDGANNSKHLRSVIRNAEHLLGVVNDILGLATLNEGRHRILNERVNLHRLLADVRDLSAQQVQGKDVTVSLTMDDALPRSVVTDPTKVRQILINLLDNAGKFTEQGTITLHASAIHDHRDDLPASSPPYLLVTVTDTGPGIPADRLNVIFEPFEQNDVIPGVRHNGTGLGLTIARALAVALGGQLTLTSKIGIGSSFSLLFPVRIEVSGDTDAPSTPPNESRPMDAEASAVAPLPLSGVRVAVADDHHDVRRILQLSLEELGADVSSVSSGGALIAMCQTKSFDVVMIDIHMPHFDGLATLRELRRRNVTAPALAVTADVTDATGRDCAAAGFAGVVSKPFRINRLVSAIQPLVPDRARVSRDSSAVSPATTEAVGGEAQDATKPLYSDLKSLSPRLAAAAAAFVVHLGDDLEKLRRAARTEDVTTLRETAHRLKGAGGINGYFRISEVASELEQYVIRRDFDEVKRHIRLMESLHTRMLAGLAPANDTREKD